MKRLVLISLLLMIVLTIGVMSHSVYGAEDEEFALLTPEEQAFYQEFSNKYREATLWFMRYDMATRRHLSSEDIALIQKALAGNRPNCSIQSSAPGVFADVKAKWNREVCPAYTTLYDKMVSIFNDNDVIEHPDWTIVRSKLISELAILSPEIDRVTDKAHEIRQLAEDRKEELIEKRKGAREKAKPVLEQIRDLLKGAGNKTEEDKDNKPKPDAGKPEDDFCFIATAAYGTPTAKEIDELRYFRDVYLRKSYLGNEFIKFYYANSPPIADFISEREVLRTVIREGFVDPIVKIVEFTETWWAE